MIKKVFILLSLFLYFFTSLFAQAPAGYYADAEGKTGSALKTALHTIIKASHNPKSYAALWEAYKTSDKKPNGKVWDMYSDRPGGTPPYEYTFGSDQCGNYSGEGSCYNREHSFPKSWFNDASPMDSDIHHIYPTDGYVNSKRGNYPFGKVNSPSWTSQNGSKVGSCSYSGYSGTVFEPIDEYKGDFARAHFYMVTRYEDKVAGWNNNGNGANVLAGNKYPAFKSWSLNMLLEWHEQDPVSQKEIDRNNAAYSFQGNRNPFVDHPEWVNCIWKNECGSAQPVITISNTSHTPAQPTPEQSVTVNTTIVVTNGSLDNVTLQWGTSSSALTNNVSLSLVSGNAYKGTIPTQIADTRIYYRISAKSGSVTEQSAIYNYLVKAETLPPEEITISELSHSPSQPIEGEIVTIRAKVTTSNSTPLTSVKLYWGISPAANTIVEMVPTSNNFYEASIPAQSKASIIIYKVEAHTQSSSVTSTVGSFVVLGQSVAGEITITDVKHSPSEPKDGENVTISATVINSGSVAIDQVWLQWWSTAEPSLIFSSTMTAENENGYTCNISTTDNLTEVCYKVNVVAGDTYKQSDVQCFTFAHTIVPEIVDSYVVFKTLSGKEATSILKVEVYDATGRRVSVQQPSGGMVGEGVRVNTATLGKGLYIFRLWQATNGKPQSFKIIL